MGPCSSGPMFPDHARGRLTFKRPENTLLRPRAAHGRGAGLEKEDNHFASAIAWLPSRGDAPVPSSPMGGPMPKSRAKPRIRPWTITTLRLCPEQAVHLLQTCHGKRVLKIGVVIGPDLAYWTHALRLAASLTAGQQFLPTLSQRGRTDHGGMDAAIYRRRRAAAGRAGRIDAVARHGAHRHRYHGTAGHSRPTRPQGVHNGPCRLPGALRRVTQQPGTAGHRFRA